MINPSPIAKSVHVSDTEGFSGVHSPSSFVWHEPIQETCVQERNEGILFSFSLIRRYVVQREHPLSIIEIISDCYVWSVGVRKYSRELNVKRPIARSLGACLVAHTPFS
jgi:hypothetical protein